MTPCKKCPHAAGGLSGVCPAVASGHRRLCELVDTAHPDYDPRYIAVILADSASPEHAPGILRKIASFAGAVVQHVAAGSPVASAEAQAARLAICQGCDQFGPDHDRCRVCGCGLSLKASWADQACPLDPPKWGPVTPDAS